LLSGLRQRFKKAVIDQAGKIKKNPEWFLLEVDNIRKVYIPQFPYNLLYTIENNIIIIWAVAHIHRKPWYWQSRMK
jgi:hypothetical protein